MAVTNKPTDTTITNSGNGNAASTKEAKAAAAAAKNTANQKKKNHPSNASNKKKQVVKSKFEGIASGTNPMKGTVIALANGNLLGQCRVYQNTLAGTKPMGLIQLSLIWLLKSKLILSKQNQTL